MVIDITSGSTTTTPALEGPLGGRREHWKDSLASVTWLSTILISKVEERVWAELNSLNSTVCVAGMKSLPPA